MFELEIISPDKIEYSGKVFRVDASGSEVDFSIVAGHMPISAVLRNSKITIYESGDSKPITLEYGGFGIAHVGYTKEYQTKIRIMV